MIPATAAEPVEQALNEYHRHQDAQPEITDDNIQRVADFLELRLIPARNNRYRHEALAQQLFDERFVDAAVDQLAEIGRMTIGSEADPAEAGVKTQEVARAVIKKIADEYFDEFAGEAHSWGWL